MLDRRVATYREAIAGIKDGATILLAGFGGSGVPVGLIGALAEAGVKDLTIAANNAGSTPDDMSLLLNQGRVRKVICSFPRSATSTAFPDAYFAGKVELEVVPQGTFVERIRAAGAGLGGFFTPVAAGTDLAKGKETRIIDGKEYVFEKPLRGDVTLLRAQKADRLGNLTYRKLARNFSPAMAMASDLVVVEADEVLEAGEIEPEIVVTPCVFVDRVVKRGSPMM
jgi:3-oxoadipate CoA-transferase, alpha subunit